MHIAADFQAVVKRQQETSQPTQCVDVLRVFSDFKYYPHGETTLDFRIQTEIRPTLAEG